MRFRKIICDVKKDILAVSDGTFGTLTGLRSYSHLAIVRYKFLEFFSETYKKYNTWMEAWDDFKKTIRNFKNFVDKEKVESETKSNSYEIAKDIKSKNINNLDKRKTDPYEIAQEIKLGVYGRNIDRQSSYSYYVRAMALKPEMDAKEWFKIYDEV